MMLCKTGAGAISVALLAASSPLALAANYQRGNLELEWLHEAASVANTAALNGLFEKALEFDDGWQFKLAIQARIASTGGANNALDIRELLFTRQWPGGALQAGLGREFWGTTESRHLVNVLNQSDFRFGADGLTKLGQPMLALNQRYANVVWKGYLLPCYRQQALTVGGVKQAGGQHDTQAAFVPLHCRHLDKAVRAEVSTGALDMGLAWFHGRTREPQRQPNQESYPEMRRWSLDGQLTLGSWLWKLEALRERSPQRSYQASVAGFEYTFSQWATMADIGILYENLHQTACPFLTCASVIGVRIGINDSAASQILLTQSIEKNSHQRAYLLKAGRRINEHSSWRIEAQKATSGWHVQSALVIGF